MSLNICIFSGELSHLSAAENAERGMYIRKELDGAGIPYKEVVGCYKGTKEISFIVSSVYQVQVEALCILLEQESYLMSDTQRITSLHYPTSGRVEILPGRLQGISPSQAMSGRFDGWTYCPTLQQYYSVW